VRVGGGGTVGRSVVCYVRVVRVCECVSCVLTGCVLCIKRFLYGGCLRLLRGVGGVRVYACVLRGRCCGLAPGAARFCVRFCLLLLRVCVIGVGGDVGTNLSASGRTDADAHQAEAGGPYKIIPHTHKIL